ncbi:Flagellar hook-basal body complex protein fliE [Desulfurobacterium thermolithotrophum DSM 11699]|uniref:Flagellar hook-basal body complex protein FliE n=1 Tax=Desulfurobacterium thermolithotrophum (strain DSM 11699 / BSA) TaxID=868864 RepID=F0S0R4_DESTD|nr:flagellar hook-basal body complex protein FliE [Desulfurobacterium thermolithotrophum]ADY73867.1 Flagellar hook-basal body complex protein fliE [Desulfurobacterium thermolithotrophum DSM 11699]
MKIQLNPLTKSILDIKEKHNQKANGFKDLLENFIKDVNSDLKESRKAEENLISGNVQNIEEIMYKIEKADLSLRLLVEIRNKALESYQEIMRMQV